MKTNQKLNDKVTHERWQNAQNWEQSHWVRDRRALAKYGKNYIWRLLSLFGVVEKYRGDDRNTWWRRMFDDYNFLPAKIENALEVGCGPYTNMRLIQNACHPAHIYLSDPLIRTYVKFRMTFVNDMYRKAACFLDDHPTEKLPFADDYFDLVAMINVLDHVQDAEACMRSIIRVTRPGGIIIIGQDLTNEDDLARQPDGLQIGHPITLDEKWFQPHLEKRFDSILNKVLPKESGWAPEWHYGTLIYAGKKRLRA